MEVQVMNHNLHRDPQVTELYKNFEKKELVSKIIF